MKYFCMPADFKQETIDEYEKLNHEYPDSRVVETYGNVTQGYNFGSGRVLDQLPRVDLLDLREYVEYSTRKNIEFNYTFNMPHMGNNEFKKEGILQIKEFMIDLYKIGVRSLTIALPSLMEIARSLESMNCVFEIKASTICHITNPNKALAYKRLGIDRIVIDESIHRDFQTLRNIRDAFGPKVEVIVNTQCHKSCIYRNFHYNEVGGHSQGIPEETGVKFYEHKCLLQRYETTSEIIKLSWIRPEDLKYYMATGIHYFKLQGRQHVAKGNPVKTLIHYIEESYDGNLVELLDMFHQRYSFQVFLDNKKLAGFLKPFYENDHWCKNFCDKCKYCETYSKKCIDHEKTLEIIDAAKTFYRGYDKFRERIYSLNPGNIEEPVNIDGDVDFEFELEDSNKNVL